MALQCIPIQIGQVVAKVLRPEGIGHPGELGSLCAGDSQRRRPKGIILGASSGNHRCFRQILWVARNPNHTGAC